MRQVGSEFVVTVSKFFSDLGPEGQRIYLQIQISTFFLMLLLAIFSFIRKPDSFSKSKIVDLLDSRWFFAFFIIMFVMMSRFPVSIFGFQNDDETFLIACSKAFLNQPRLWVACDTSTAGPLTMLPLMTLRIFGLPIDVGSAKLVAAVVITLSIVFLYFSFDVLLGKALARTAIMPLIVAVALAMTTFWDFFSYNAEHVPLLILSASLYVLVKIYILPDYSVKMFVILGLLLGLIPFAKIQAIPLALTIALAGLVLHYRTYKFKGMSYFIGSGLLPSFFFLVWTYAGGGLDYFWNSYILFNMYYAESEVPQGLTLLDKIGYAWQLILNTKGAVLYFQSGLIFSFFCLVFLDFNKFFKFPQRAGIIVFSLLFFIVSLLCIGQPHRPYLHYTLFAFLSLSVLSGTAIYVFTNPGYISAFSDTHKKIILTASIIFISLFFFFQHFSFSPVYNIYAETNKNGAVIEPNVVLAINKHSSPGDYMAIWGWKNVLYSDTDLISGTRLPGTSGILNRNSYSNYFLSFFLADMERNKPKIFIDAINSKAWAYGKRDQYGINKFPALKEYVNIHYTQVEDVDDFRIYIHK
jgi:hypothetical protein